MKQELKKKFENSIYIMMCILSGGVAWLSRLLITKAIVEAEKQTK